MRGALVLGALLAASTVAHRSTAPAAQPVDPGSIVRWSAPGTRRCGMGKHSWPALEATCYYPIDVKHRPGTVTVVRRGEGAPETARVMVGRSPYGSEEIELGDIPQAHPTREDRRRNASEQAHLARVLRRSDGEARFTLPLDPPAHPLPPGKTFGWTRFFDGALAPQPHMGSDYAVPAGSAVTAAADGTVVLAEELFYPGRAVILDHGDGLFTMYFHLSEISVEVGQDVRRGGRLGTVGETGRATGPHLMFAARWHGARIDPKYLFEDPAKIASVERLERGAGAEAPKRAPTPRARGSSSRS